MKGKKDKMNECCEDRNIYKDSMSQDPENIRHRLVQV